MATGEPASLRAAKPPSLCAAARHSPIKARPPPRLSCVWARLVVISCAVDVVSHPAAVLARSASAGVRACASMGPLTALGRAKAMELEMAEVCVCLAGPRGFCAAARSHFPCPRPPARLSLASCSFVASVCARRRVSHEHALVCARSGRLICCFWPSGHCGGAGAVTARALWRLIGDKPEEVEETRQQAKSREASTTDDRRPMALLIRLHEVDDDCVVHSVCADALVTRTPVMSPRPPLWAGWPGSGQRRLRGVA